MSWALLALAAVDVGLLIWAGRHYVRQPGNLALGIQTILLLLLWFDVGTVAVGGWLGAGPLLEGMSRVRYAWFYLTMPLLLIGAVALARQAGFAWAARRWPLIAAIALAIVFIALDVPRALTADYQTACFADTLRYVSKVPAGQACAPGEEGLGRGAFSPAIPLVFLAVAAIGVALWWRRRWPWLGAAALAFLASSLIPPRLIGPFLTYPLDTLMTAAFAAAALRFPPRPAS